MGNGTRRLDDGRWRSRRGCTGAGGSMLSSCARLQVHRTGSRPGSSNVDTNDPLVAGRYYRHLLMPEVRPEMICFVARRNTMTSGIVAMVRPAKSCGQSVEYSPKNLVSPTGSV